MKQLSGVNSQRISERIAGLSQIGKMSAGGVTRKALTKEDFEAQRLTAKWMKEAGLTVRTDSFGNLIGRKDGQNPMAPAVIIGSHIDTVPNGDNYDGTIGVIGAIEIAQLVHEENISIVHPLEIVSFCDEEGTRFHGGLFGSRAMSGSMQKEELYLKDEDGISRLEALNRAGIFPVGDPQDIKHRGEVKVYLEMHIEQGPYLEKIGEPIGIVTGIAGPAWMSVKVIGESGHAGTVPMTIRKDPMAGAAEMISALEQICLQEPGAPTVGTVGKLTVKPGGANVIPESVEFSVDLRDIDVNRRNKRLQEAKEMFNEVCRKRGLGLELTEHLLQKPVQCSNRVIQTMKNAAKILELDPPEMISGAGHDAMSISEIAEIGMIFVRCRGGISHNPKERAEIDDISKGTSLLLETALQFL